jgi:hypothetical protein
MSDSTTPDTDSPATDEDGKLLLSAPAADALLRQCLALIKVQLHDLVMMSIETTNDLFEANEFVKDDAAMAFRNMRVEWVTRFDKAFNDLFEKRMSGGRRKGRRVDHDASLATLRVLNAFDQEQQAALTKGAFHLFRMTRREANALDLRIAVLLREPRAREVDNPFSPAYLLDAMGLTSRELFPDPRIWRPLLVRLIADTTPGINNAYIRVNRFLADRHVLPEIKAELRARSELRPADDAELLPMFMRLITEAGPSEADKLLALNIEVPPASAPSAAPEGAPASFSKPAAPLASPASAAPSQAAPSAPPPAPASQVSPPTAPGPAPVSAPAADAAGIAGASAAPGVTTGGDIHTLRAAGLQPAPWPPSSNPYALDVGSPVLAPTAPAIGAFGLPQLDPMLALGSLASAVALLDRWQRIDPGGEIRVGDEAATGSESALLPLNRIPYIRAAIADKIVNSTDKITIDVIGLLFDYIFRDPSIPESLRSRFSCLQVPVPRRRWSIAVSFPTGNTRRDACSITWPWPPSARLAAGDTESVQAHLRRGHRRSLPRLQGRCRGVRRCRREAAGIRRRRTAQGRRCARPGGRRRASSRRARRTVRMCARSSATSWRTKSTLQRALFQRNHLGRIPDFAARQGGTQSEDWHAAVQTLDNLLWSITAKERTAQKARLAKMVPPLIRSLRAGGASVEVGDDRMKPFLEAVYELHMAAIKPEAAARGCAARGLRGPPDASDAAGPPTVVEWIPCKRSATSTSSAKWSSAPGWRSRAATRRPRRACPG